MSRSIGVRSLLSAGINKLKATSDEIPITGTRRAVVIATAAQKGGVGKTTTSVNLACAWAKHFKYRVLVIDVDPQGHVSSSLRDSLKPARASISDVLLAERPRDILDAVFQTDFDGLSLTAADKGLAETDAQLATRVGREYILKAAIANARSHFDIIIIDCPPNLGNLTLNALVAADCVLIPCDMSILAFEGVADLLGTVRTVNLRLGQNLDVAGIIRTRVDGRTRQINDAIGRALTDNYGDLLLESMIPINSALAKAQAAGMSIYDFQAKSRGAEAYTRLAGELQDRLNLKPTAASAGRGRH
ncbi:MAG: ParA family protein [Bradymonadia bacterium]